jgi:hypothetical protein
MRQAVFELLKEVPVRRERLEMRQNFKVGNSLPLAVEANHATLKRCSSRRWHVMPYTLSVLEQQAIFVTLTLLHSSPS